MKKETKPDSKKVVKLINKLEATGWNLTNEREFVENLFVGRFNYFLVVYSLFMTAGFANSFQSLKYLVFYLGALILTMCMVPLFRAYYKHDRILRIIFKYKKEHPAYQIEEILKEWKYKHYFTVSKWMGIYIPSVCILTLITIGIFINTGLLK